VLRSGSPRLVIQEAWAWLADTQLVRASAAAALHGAAADARALRRKDNAPVTADEESFTAVWRHAVRSMTSSHVTASSSLDALAAAADAAARAALRTLNVPRPPAPLTTRPESPPEIRAHHRDETDRHRQIPGHGVRARYRVKPRPGRTPVRKEEPPPPRGAADRGTARHPAATRGQNPCPRPGQRNRETDSEIHTEHRGPEPPAGYKHLKSLVLRQ
jgi:hypothetical protein